MSPTGYAEPHHGDTDRRRWGEAFSLDEAARIRKSLLSGAPVVKCPHCLFALELVGESADAEHTSLVSCHRCGRSVVLSLLREEAGARSGRG